MTETPRDPLPCGRYFGSDGTLCSTHGGRFTQGWQGPPHCDGAPMAITSDSFLRDALATPAPIADTYPDPNDDGVHPTHLGPLPDPIPAQTADEDAVKRIRAEWAPIDEAFGVPETKRQELAEQEAAAIRRAPSPDALDEHDAEVWNAALDAAMETVKRVASLSPAARADALLALLSQRRVLAARGQQ
jgi:hypothetical protein